MATARGTWCCRIFAPRAGGDPIHRHDLPLGWRRFPDSVAGHPTTGACDLAERLHQAVVTAPFRVGSGKVLHVTVTIGVATVRASEDLLDAVHRADAALYQNQQGRNQVVLAKRPQGQDARPERARSLPCGRD